MLRVHPAQDRLWGLRAWTPTLAILMIAGCAASLDEPGRRTVRSQPRPSVTPVTRTVPPMLISPTSDGSGAGSSAETSDEEGGVSPQLGAIRGQVFSLETLAWDSGKVSNFALGDIDVRAGKARATTTTYRDAVSEAEGSLVPREDVDDRSARLWVNHWRADRPATETMLRVLRRFPPTEARADRYVYLRDGEFLLEGLEPGSVTVSTHLDSDVWGDATQSVEVRAGETVDAPPLKVAARPELVGRGEAEPVLRAQLDRNGDLALTHLETGKAMTSTVSVVVASTEWPWDARAVKRARVYYIMERADTPPEVLTKPTSIPVTSADRGKEDGKGAEGPAWAAQLTLQLPLPPLKALLAAPPKKLPQVLTACIQPLDHKDRPFPTKRLSGIHYGVARYSFEVVVTASPVPSGSPGTSASPGASVTPALPASPAISASPGAARR